jgi:hypothetical protein
MITVACVMKTGGRYDASWAGKLARGVARNLTLPYRFICLTDAEAEVQAEGVEAVTLPDGWPGWWSKISLWNPNIGLTGPCFYLDLDTVIVGNLDAIASHPHRFTMCHEFYRPELLCSTAMAWTGDHSHIWHAMQDMTPERRAQYDRWEGKRIGDQAFIEDCKAGQHVDTFRDLFGERSIASYKVHCRKGLHGDEAAVAFHGALKQPDLLHIDWIKEQWR